MRRTRPTHPLTIAASLCLASWMALTGCASTTPPSTADAARAETPEEVAARQQREARLAAEAAERQRIATELDDELQRYTVALEGVVTGELTPDALDGAIARVDRLAEECRAVAGCAVAPFRAAYGRIVRMQHAALATQQQNLELATLEPEGVDAEREPGTAPFAGEMPELDRAVFLLQGNDLRDLITLNGPVNAALDDWLTWLRPALIQSYRNYQYLRPAIAPIYEDAGLPEALLFAMIATESRGKVHSTSRAGAAGLLQFMPATGRVYGLRSVDGFDQRFDPVAATRANVQYLNVHFRQFNHSLEKVLGAYNGGEGRMRGLHRRLSGNGFWDERFYYSLPRETREYVPRILAAAWLFLHPEEYGLEFPDIEAAATELKLAEPMALDELAICLGQEGNPDGWFRTLRNLNPQFEPGERVPLARPVVVPVGLVELYDARCRDSEIVAKARALHDANYPPQPRTTPYVVRRGDTLGRIASRVSCANVSSIARMNNVRAPGYVIREGQRLRLPSCG